jgi:protein tyrosine phosphatase (PTP) superfamily phosphohydrolase (DUF442 family)
MDRSFTRLLLGTALGTLAIQGCQHPCRQPAPAPPPPVISTPVPAPAPLSPYAPAPQPLPQTPSAPVPPSAAIRGYEPPLAPPLEPSWRPSTENGVRLAPPEPPLASPPQAGARLQTPQITTPAPSPSPGSESSTPTPLLPAGIPQFALAKDQVATGLKPMLDGVDWLQQNGYRTVLHLRQPGEDDAAERRLFELRGLKYLSLEVSPQTLSRAVVADFNRIVSDRSLDPLFVYDKAGALSGGLWYLYFRHVEHQSDEEARLRASRLGLRETQEGLQKEMWLAIQKYLSE